MPNHVTNIVYAEPEVLDAIRDNKGIVDLFKLLPLPNSLDERPFSEGIPVLVPEFLLDDIKRAKEQGNENRVTALQTLASNSLECGYSDSIDWANSVMGTKWGGYDYDEERSNEETLVFDTAWATPIEGLRELSADFPDKPIAVKYADEDTGRNVGSYILIGGAVAYIVNDSMSGNTTMTDGKWMERAIEIKGYDRDDEDFAENYKVVNIHHSVFLDGAPIIKLTPQFNKLFKTEERSELLVAILTQFLGDALTFTIEYVNGKVTIHYGHGLDWKVSNFIELSGVTMFEFDIVAMKNTFAELSQDFTYHTEVTFNNLLGYVDSSAADIMTSCITAGNFLSLRYRIFNYRKSNVNDYQPSLDWIKVNRGIECDAALDVLEKYLLGKISYGEWCEVADLPRQSLIPERISNNTDARIMPTGHHVFKHIAGLYSYRDIITDVDGVVTYTHPKTKYEFSLPYEKFPVKEIGLCQ